MAREYSLTAAEQRWQVSEVDKESRKTDIRLRKHFAWAIIALMFLLNIFTVGFLSYLSYQDKCFREKITQIHPEVAIDFGKSGVYFVNSQVLMALVGATVVQVGTALVVITQYLFPRELKHAPIAPRRRQVK